MSVKTRTNQSKIVKGVHMGKTGRKTLRAAWLNWKKAGGYILGHDSKGNEVQLNDFRTYMLNYVA